MSTSISVDLVIFDCDGVLIDSEIICAEVLSRELAALGVRADRDYILQQFLGISYTSMARKIQQNLHHSLPEGFKSHYRDQILRAFEDRLRTTRGVEKVLHDLNVTSCVATSSSPARTARALELAGLTQVFGANVFTASEVTNGKPAPDLFLHAAKRMNVEPGRCLVIEDSIAGLSAADAAGMNAWRYVGASHLVAMDPILPDNLSGTTVFNHWDEFFEMAPQLRKPDPTLSAVDGH